MHEHLESPPAARLGKTGLYIIIIYMYAFDCIFLFAFCFTSSRNAFMKKISSAVHQLFPNFPGGSASLAAMFDRSQYQFPSSHV